MGTFGAAPGAHPDAVVRGVGGADQALVGPAVQVRVLPADEPVARVARLALTLVHGVAEVPQVDALRVPVAGVRLVPAGVLRLTHLWGRATWLGHTDLTPPRQGVRWALGDQRRGAGTLRGCGDSRCWEGVQTLGAMLALEAFPVASERRMMSEPTGNRVLPAGPFGLLQERCALHPPGWSRGAGGQVPTPIALCPP